MALIVSFKNVTDLDPISDYKVDIWINDRHIDGPFLLKHHKREDGWQALVRLFGRTFCNPEWTKVNQRPEPPKLPRITHNKIHCRKCNTTLESRFTHDFRSCKCGNFVDGGGSYVRYGGNFDEIEVLTEYEKEESNEPV